MGYEQVMSLPLKTFWLMVQNIDRIEAKKDMRSMSVALVSQSTAEGVKQYRETLVVEAGEIVKLDAPAESPLNAPRDEDGVAELKRMAGQRIGSTI